MFNSKEGVHSILNRARIFTVSVSAYNPGPAIVTGFIVSIKSRMFRPLRRKGAILNSTILRLMKFIFIVVFHVRPTFIHVLRIN